MVVNQKELASILGITDRRVRELKSEYGLFSSEAGAGHKKYVLERCVPEFINYKLEEAGKSSKAMDKERVQAEHENVKKQISMLKLRKLRGELHEANDVERYLTDMLLAFREKLLDIPGKTAILLADEDDVNVITSILEKEIYQAMEALSEYDPEEIDGELNLEDLTEDEDDD